MDIIEVREGSALREERSANHTPRSVPLRPRPQSTAALLCAIEADTSQHSPLPSTRLAPADTMQSTRFLATNMLRQARASPVLRLQQQQLARGFRTTPKRMAGPVRRHTQSQTRYRC